MTIRRCVAIVTDRDDDIKNMKPDMTVTTSEHVWRQIMAKEKSAVVAAMTSSLKVDPSVAKLGEFFGYFDLERE